MKKLVFIDLSFTIVTDAALKELAAQGHSNLIGINLYHTKVTNVGIGYLGKMTALISVVLNGNITDEGLRTLLPSTKLQSLAFGSTRITDTGMKYVGQFRKLEQLGFSSNQITDKGIVEIADLTDLVNVALEGKKFTDASTKYMSRLRNIRMLTLVNDQLTNKALANLSELKPVELWTLEIRSPKVTDEGLSSLREQKNLSELVLTGNRIRGPGLANLADLPHLTKLSVADVTDEQLKYIAKIKSLVTLVCDRPKFTVDGLRALKSNKNLKEIDLNTCENDDVEPFRGVLPGVTVSQSVRMTQQDDE
jgi:Leucine-rich repeat (LRR) protein